MCCWIDYGKSGLRRDYLRALALFLVAMLCKISMAPFPVVILLYAWWKRGRIGGRDVLASLPFFSISVIFSLLTTWSSIWYMQSQFKVNAAVYIGGFFSRLALSGQTLAFYFAKCFWPVNLMPIYPQWKVDPSAPIQFLPWIVLAALMVALWCRRKSWGRHVLLGLGFFILMLGPFLGFVGISYLSFTWVMDHFLYVPIIGIIGLVVAGIEDIDARLPSVYHPVSTGLITVIVALLAFKAHWYASAFTGDETLWTYTLDRNPGAWLAHSNLGKILLKEGEPEQARQHFERVIASQPDLGESYCDLGVALVQLGRFPEAVTAFNQALKRDPYSPEANNNFGILLAQMGRTDDAILHFTFALHRHPRYTDAHINLGNALLLAGHASEAIEQFQTAIGIDPDSLSAHDDLALALENNGHAADAENEYRQALQINPNDAKALQGLDRLQKAQTPPGAK
jgi:Flp pilus assembly protein TadD